MREDMREDVCNPPWMQVLIRYLSHGSRQHTNTSLRTRALRRYQQAPRLVDMGGDRKDTRDALTAEPTTPRYCTCGLDVTQHESESDDSDPFPAGSCNLIPV
jgi:hypothetical protein